MTAAATLLALVGLAFTAGCNAETPPPDSPAIRIAPGPAATPWLIVCSSLADADETRLLLGLATDGRSKVNFAEALRTAGADVQHCFVLFYYDIFPKSRELMTEIGINLHYLTTWWDVLAVAKESGHFDAKILAEVESFLNDPATWSAKHGGISAFGEEKKPA